MYGRLDASPEGVEAAAVAARAHGFVQELSAKYETEVGERGAKLSSGSSSESRSPGRFRKTHQSCSWTNRLQRWTCGPRRILLDGLADLMAGRTVFIVAHRLSTIRNVDRIYFLENGMLAEQGAHEELMRLRGRYYDLFMRQFGSGATEPAVV